MQKIKLTRKTRQVVCELLKPRTEIVGEQVVKPYEKLEQHQVTHFIVKRAGVTQEMVDNYNRL